MADIKLTVTVDDAHIDATRTVAASLAGEGFTVESTIPEAGAIFGSAREETIEQLAKVEGVLEVRHSTSIALAPIDENIPQ